jgi:hypothetical protein
VARCACLAVPLLFKQVERARLLDQRIETLSDFVVRPNVMDIGEPLAGLPEKLHGAPPEFHGLEAACSPREQGYHR